MSSESNKALVRSFYEEVFNSGDLTRMEDLVADSYVDHDPTNPAGTRDGLKQTAIGMRTAFPDAEWTIEDLIAEGDTVVARVTMRGTQTGEMMGIPPTGKSVTASGIDIIRIADGKAVEHWGEFDSLGMLQQLGVIPMPG